MNYKLSDMMSDTIEIHAAHGYLVSSFLSPCSNNRTDLYGDSFENRIRLLVEIVKAIRDRIPDDMPLFVRISATDWMEYSPETPQWAIDDSVKLAVVLNNIGVDLIDVSSGGNNASQKVPAHDAFYQVKLAEQITQVLRNERKSMLVGAVGYINSATRARDVLEEQMADIVLVGREFMRSPGLVQTWAAELGLGVNYPRQYIKLNTASIGTA
jgi:2,4-dienoyl-CoA reductase-like NADH-dependent reductase (Old Yellow Enzyme family)